MPVCSMKTSCAAPVPPCMPSTTITSAPASTACRTSAATRVAPIFTYTGMRQEVTSRSSSILTRSPSGPVQSGCRLAERWSTPSGRSRMNATGVVIFCPSSMLPPPGVAPWPSTISTASAERRSSGSKP